MSDAIGAFLHYLAVERGASAHTLRSYRSDIDRFQRFLEEQGIDGFERVDGRLIRVYLARLLDARQSRASVGRALAAIRSCFRFMARRGLIEKNPARVVSSPRLPKKLVSFLPVDETWELLGNTAAGSPREKRDRAMLELLYATGIRVS